MTKKNRKDFLSTVRPPLELLACRLQPCVQAATLRAGWQPRAQPATLRAGRDLACRQPLALGLQPERPGRSPCVSGLRPKPRAPGPLCCHRAAARLHLQVRPFCWC